MMRTDEALERLPRIASAFDRREISAGHVRLLTRVASPENESFWLRLAWSSSVQELARAIARGRPPDGEEGLAGSASMVSVSAELGDDERALERWRLAAPAWMASLWRTAVALVRRIHGARIPPGECLEHLLAEASTEGTLAGFDEAPAEEKARLSADPPGGDTKPGGDRSDPDSGGDPTAGAVGGWSVGPGASGDPEPGRVPGADDPGSSAEGDTPLPPYADALDAALRSLIHERQRRDDRIARHLAGVARGRWFRTIGYRTLEAYAFERYAVSPRNLYYLLALARALQALPEMRRDFLSGALTTRQVLLLGKVARRRTLRAWVERARAVTLRRLEEEVSFWKHLQETRPDVWRTLDGLPLPEGFVVLDGERPRLHTSARGTDGSSAAGAGPAVSPMVSLSPAERLMNALQSSERSDPMPQRRTTISMMLEPEVLRMWQDTVASLRERAGRPLQEWEVLALVMNEFMSVWDNAETRRQRRLQPILEREGWRCAAPGCSAMGSGRLEDHHIRFRSAGGSDDLSNRVAVCKGHHRLIHLGIVRVTGTAPDDLTWEMGCEPGKEPFLVYKNEMRIGGVAP
jgi:hypothetical protein